METWWLPRWFQAGIKVRPLGLPKLVEGQPTLAVAIEVSEEILASICAFGGLKPFELKRYALNGAVPAEAANAA